MLGLILKKKNMKKIILFIGIILISLNCNSQNQKATLYLKTGDTIHGLAKIKAFGKIKFRYNKKSKKEIYSPYQLIKFDIIQQGSKTTNIYKYVQGNQLSTSRKCMTLITEGKIDLYRISVSGTHPSMGFGGGGMGGMTVSYSMDNYYVSKDDSDVVTKLTTVGTFFGKSFKKAASEYFSDCQDLVDRIQNKTYRKRDIEEIVRFYNTKCN